MDKERHLADLRMEFFTEKLRHMYLLQEAHESLQKMKDILDEMTDL